MIDAALAAVGGVSAATVSALLVRLPPPNRGLLARPPGGDGTAGEADTPTTPAAQAEG